MLEKFSVVVVAVVGGGGGLFDFTVSQSPKSLSPLGKTSYTKFRKNVKSGFRDPPTSYICTKFILQIL